MAKLVITCRSITKSEQDQVIDLWKKVFGPEMDGYFERYFSPLASPHYIEGDCLGAFIGIREDVLISVVYIRRMYVKSSEEKTKYLCGVVSNVATVPEYRNNGLSRELLRQSINKMNDDKFDFSILGTGRTNHYTPLGWKSVTMKIEYFIEADIIEFPSFDESIIWTSITEFNSYEKLFDIFQINPRPYGFDRNHLSLFEHWVGWHWKHNNSFIGLLSNNQGYIILSEPDGKHGHLNICEWKATDSENELKLLSLAAKDIVQRFHRKNFQIHTYPQYTDFDALKWTKSKILFEQNADIMFRNIQLNENTFQRIQQSFENANSRSTIWLEEYF